MRKTKILQGALEAYWEQGWEGRIEFSLQVERQERPNIFLQNGQRLTIYSVDDQILWSGTLDFIRRNTWLDQHKLKAEIWAYTKQRGVSYAQWMEWFWHEPPLKATLEIDDTT